jgi:hypothetical protein
MTEVASHSERGPIAKRGPQPLAATIALLSFSVLLYEILLTRIFSVVLLYHFAYVAISLALLGFSAGALWLHYHPSLSRFSAVSCSCSTSAPRESTSTRG